MQKTKKESNKLTNILNNHATSIIRWCTPSLDPNSSRVNNPYISDISVSYQSLGYPYKPSGIFKEAYDRAAKIYGADHTLFSVNGTTGSNFVVLRALSKQIPNLRILAQRNIHRSIAVACEDYRINLILLPANIDQDLQIFLPNKISEIIESIRRTKPNVLLLTNPTYDGLVLDLESLIEKVRKEFPELIIFVEEAWGSHIHFSNKLPVSAMEAGADIAVQSTHKQGGALQQSGMIHWKNGKVDTELMVDSYKTISTSSPSYILLASLDAAADFMKKNGKRRINQLLDIAECLGKLLNSIPGLKVIDTKSLSKKNRSVFDRDETKVILDVSAAKLNGFEIANILEEKYRIISEKYDDRTILFIVPFQATKAFARVTASAIKEILNNSSGGRQNISGEPFNLPKDTRKVLEMGDVSNLLQSQIEKVPLKEAVGRISAENITPYPPGIPITVKGEEFNQDTVEYYLKYRSFPNGHIIANDPTMGTVLVVK